MHERQITDYYSKRLIDMTGVSSHTVSAEDLSLLTTNDLLTRFFDLVSINRQSNKPIDYQHTTRHTTSLLRRFFLGIGIPLYQNREYVLKQFESRLTGEEEFLHLMNFLHFTDHKIPRSLSEARQVFLSSSVL